MDKMTVNLKLKQGAEEYRQKLKLGLVETPKLLDPMEKAKQNPKSLRAAINAKCFDCCCYQKPEVRHCTAVDCPLHHLRPWQQRDE